MSIEFTPSPRSTVGLEWELMLVDPESGVLVPRAPEILTTLEHEHTDARYTVTGELLTNTIEVTSGVGETVRQAVGDISDAVSAVTAAATARGIALLSAGSHPFAQWYDQEISDKSRYHRLIERTQWWGRNMMIWGVHVHIGIESRDKVMPIMGALATFLPHLQALSSSSPFWAGERTGYASNRALVFQQLPTAGLPWTELQSWDQFENYLDDMVRTGVMSDASEVRWDIRPAPRWGTVEVRACDGFSTLAELASVAALTQVLVEHFSRRLDRGDDLPLLPAWYHRENKWRAARYGLDARLIVDPQGNQSPVRDEVERLLSTLLPLAQDLGCEGEFSHTRVLLDRGTSAERQLAVAEQNSGDLVAVVRHLIQEFASGTPAAL